ncbi:MAG: hypothetical protein ACNA8W_07775 [Bradymonadaceae bacterium]
MNREHTQKLKYYFSALIFSMTGLLGSPVLAQGMHLPIVGRQFPTVGLSLNPGFFYDGSSDHPDVGTLAPTGGGALRLGLQHIVSTGFSMNGELQLGMQWVSRHTATPFGVAPSQTAFAWQVGMLGRWFPIGEQKGWTAAVGAHYFRAGLEDAPLVMIGADLRLGRFIWTSDERFVIIEVGYSAPLIQGLRISPILAEEVGDEFIERTWSFHRFGIGFTMAF